MKILNVYLTIAILLLSLSAIAQHSYQVKKISADSAWNKLNLILGDAGNDFASKQTKYSKYREEGLKLWKMFPMDERRYTWLYYAVMYAPNYWKIKEGTVEYKHLLFNAQSNPVVSYSLPIDKKKLKEWEDTFPSMKKQLINYCAQNPKFWFGGMHFDSGNPMNLIECEFFEFFKLSLNKSYREKGKIDLNKLKKLIDEAGEFLKNENPNKPNWLQSCIFNPLDANFISCYKEYGLSDVEMKSFFDLVKGSPVPVIRNWAIQRSSLFALMNEPLNLKHKSIDGRPIDLADMRGKVVLVDFWATTCSTCIARMPAIKEVYDKYQRHGFEVISACSNYGDETKRIKEVEKQIGADWPILAIGGKTKEETEGSLGERIFRKYGFHGVPQLLLFNKQGKLVMLNDKLRNGDFEPIVKQLLSEKYNSN